MNLAAANRDIKVSFTNDAYLGFMTDEDGIICHIYGVDLDDAGMTDAEYDIIYDHFIKMPLEYLRFFQEEIGSAYKYKVSEGQMSTDVDTMLKFRAKCFVEKALFGHITCIAHSQFEINSNQLLQLLQGE